VTFIDEVPEEDLDRAMTWTYRFILLSVVGSIGFHQWGRTDEIWMVVAIGLTGAFVSLVGYLFIPLLMPRWDDFWTPVENELGDDSVYLSTRRLYKWSLPIGWATTAFSFPVFLFWGFEVAVLLLASGFVGVFWNIVFSLAGIAIDAKEVYL